VQQQRHLVNGNVKLGRAAARSGEWAQHFSNASCFVMSTEHSIPLLRFVSWRFSLLAGDDYYVLIYTVSRKKPGQ